MSRRRVVVPDRASSDSLYARPCHGLRCQERAWYPCARAVEVHAHQGVPREGLKSGGTGDAPLSRAPVNGDALIEACEATVKAQRNANDKDASKFARSCAMASPPCRNVMGCRFSAFRLDSPCGSFFRRRRRRSHQRLGDFPERKQGMAKEAGSEPGSPPAEEGASQTGLAGRNVLERAETSDGGHYGPAHFRDFRGAAKNPR